MVVLLWLADYQLSLLLNYIKKGIERKENLVLILRISEIFLKLMFIIA